MMKKFTQTKNAKTNTTAPPTVKVDALLGVGASVGKGVGGIVGTTGAGVGAAVFSKGESGHTHPST